MPGQHAFPRRNPTRACSQLIVPRDMQRSCDVIMPASPFFLYHSPPLLQQLLAPLLLHAANKTKMMYNNSWGVHDLGTWPICDETPYGQEQMPIEETANM